ncbi:MAG: YdcF family protein [Gammaproteobacteria bacterium]|nr:YdcF family protein [Gammaproteobacteria bacterium]
MRLLAGKPNPDFRLRLERAHHLHQQTGCRLLLMGGVTGSETISEADAGKQFLVAQGIAPSALILEDGSRNTLENLRNSREQLRHGNIRRYALASNRYHLARCQALANGLGLYPALCAAEDHFMAAPSGWPRLLLEAFYLHWYHTGKWWSRLSRSRHSLSRIS